MVTLTLLSLISLPSEAGNFTPAAYARAVLAASPEVRQARETLAASDAQRKSQWASAALPTVSLTGVGTPFGHSSLRSGRYNRWHLQREDLKFTTTLNLNIFNSWQDFQKVRASSRSRESAWASLRGTEQTRSFEAIKAFFDLNLKNKLLEVAEQNRAAQESQFKLTQDLYQNGMKSLSDLLKSETDWRSGELRVASAEAEERLALLRFNLLIEREPLQSASLEADLSPGTTEMPRVADDVVRALTQRPEIIRSRKDLERIEIARQQALQGMLPTLGIDANWSRTDYGPASSTLNPTYKVGLALSMPFNYNFVSQLFSYRSASADKKRQEAALALAERSTREELHAAYISLDRAFKAYRISIQKESLSERNLGIVTEQYRQGSADVIRLAQAQLDLLNARVERAQALNDTFINRAAYRLAVGDPVW